MYDRDDFVALFETGFKTTLLDQCTYGGQTAKPTDLRASWIDFAALQSRCNHPKTWHWWDRAGGGKYIWAAHPLTVACKDASGKQWATKQQAAYPKQLNIALAEAISKAAWTIHRMRKAAASFNQPQQPPAAPAAAHQTPVVTGSNAPTA